MRGYRPDWRPGDGSRLSWRRSALVVVVIFGLATAVSALVAGIKAPPTIVELVGAAAAAAAAVLAVPAKRVLDERHKTSKAIADPQLVKRPAVRSRAAVRLQLVREACNPLELGMHPAADLPATADLPPDVRSLPPNTPSYVPRDKDLALRAALHPGSFVLILGDSAAGKTRSAFEAARAVLPDYFLLNPERDGLTALLDANAVPHRCLVWLDDIQQYIRFIPAGAIRQVLGIRDVVVLATMRATEYDRFAPVEIRKGTGKHRAPSPAGWEVLRGATKIHWSRRFSESEQARAREHVNDPRIAEAISHLHEYGLAEYLAAGPRLLERWRNAIDVNGHPRAAAIIAAAVDCRRTGLTTPLSEAILDELHYDYLQAWGGDRLRPESFAEALAWATTPVHATTSLLMPTSDGYTTGFRAFDYLVDAVQNDAAAQPIPLTVWGVMLSYSDATTARSSYATFRHAPRDAEDLFWLGSRFEQVGNTAEAVRSYEAAMQPGHADAAFKLATMARHRGDLTDAENLYSRASDLGHVEGTRFSGELCYLRAGLTEARQIWRDIEDKANAETTFAIGDFLRRKGDVVEAIAWFERAADRNHQASIDQLADIASTVDSPELSAGISEQVSLLRAAHGHATEKVEAARRLAHIRNLQGEFVRARKWQSWAEDEEARQSPCL